MSTLFNLVGTFQHEKRERVGGPVKCATHKVTLVAGIIPEEASAYTPAQLERMADINAVRYSKHTPWERMWMTDWELVEIKQEQVA